MQLTSPTPHVTAALRTLGTAPDTYGPTLNTAVSPAAVETLGTALAEALREHRPDALAVWSTGDEMVLAHVVARELGAAVVHATAVEGVTSLAPDVAPGARLVPLATAWEEAGRLSTLRVLAENHRAEVVAVASVLATPALRTVVDLPTIQLAASREEEA